MTLDMSGVWKAILSVLVVLSFAASAAGESVRPSALAGGWYPADAQELKGYVDGLLDAAKVQPLSGEIRALVAPHAGYQFSGATAAEVFSLVRGREFKRVLVLAPSHRSGFQGLSIADVDAYETPLGRIPLDAETIARLRESHLVQTDPIAHEREHAIEIELPFLQLALAPGWRLIPVLVGGLDAGDYQAVAELLRPVADDDTLVVVSTDFTHFGPRFGYLPFPPDDQAGDRIRTLDEGAIERILARDAEGLMDYQASTGITICGYRPLALLLKLMPADAEVKQVGYATSGEVTDDWLNSVSYVGLVVTGPSPVADPSAAAQSSAIGEAELQLLHRLAVCGVEEAVLGDSESRREVIEALLAGMPARLREPGGAFVTLKREGQLRGCIGYILSDRPLYQAVLENGFNAARNDCRFWPVTEQELAGLEIEVSVLSAPEPIRSYAEFRVGEQGVILSKDGRQAVFLPEVALQQGWSREETLKHLALKAGLPEDGWRDGADFRVFTSTKYRGPYAPVSALVRPNVIAN